MKCCICNKRVITVGYKVNKKRYRICFNCLDLSHEIIVKKTEEKKNKEESK